MNQGKPEQNENDLPAGSAESRVLPAGHDELHPKSEAVSVKPLPGNSPADAGDPAGDPVNVVSILNKLPCLNGKGIMEAVNTRIQRKSLARNWIKIVGQKLAEHTAPITLQNQKLIVVVDDPKWMTALKQTEGIFRKKVNEFLKSDQPLSIELRLGKISPLLSRHPSSPKAKPEPAPGLTAKQEERIESLLSPIKNNEKLKQTLKDILTRHCRHDQRFLEKDST
ncbi:MAG: DUF721 domain-containing protein [bacterium]